MGHPAAAQQRRLLCQLPGRRIPCSALRIYFLMSLLVEQLTN
jgi:hypothetical protein